mgnify:CR=1 FL=1
MRLERFKQNRLGQRLQRAARCTLQDSKRNERAEVRRDPAQKRRHGEAGHRHHQQPLAAEGRREPSGHRQDDRVGDEYDVSTHVASSMVADIVAAMCGSDTLTTVVSSTSMKVPNITAIATIHGLTCLCSAIRDY